MTFPEKLLSERQRLRLTQAEAAALLEISKSALEKWEAGTKTPKALMQEGALARLVKFTPPKPTERAQDPLPPLRAPMP